MIHDGVATLEQ